MKAKRLSKAQQLSLTTLPQAIIETILCLLPTAEAARTSILSREWRYKWTTIPKLVFSQSTFKKSIEAGPLIWSDWVQISDLERARRYKDMRCELFYAIHQVLLLRQGPIHEFTLLMSADRTCFELDQILLHLSRNHTIKKLTLTLYHSDPYGLPLSVFSLHHLTDLCLEYCAINHKPIFNGFGSLTSLTLNQVRISRETLLHLLSNCPSLKSLYMVIDEEEFVGDEYPFMEPSNMELFKCLPMIEHLTTSGYLIMSLVQASIPEELPASLIHLKCCTIEDMCFVDAYGLPFLADLIKCSPNLEKIKLEINADCCIETKGDKLEEHSVNLEEYSYVWLEHLNELEIRNICNYKSELEFVKFILARSPNLKKVILVTWMDDKNEEFEMLKILLRVPRASPVEISVESKF
ncbi:F-box/FBD/LRR-repeat protein At1g13570 isoform X1 [Helianthus annuus]|uniref:F-box/FBD/LRR-repeat protein At1g13570 isoform X1 n=2 Tax=Helianthus annuus TaxID=4232 RepID=UPI000B907D14|nr:F-box/FBD/LRR-repeat protein At1g13570 isoform X1 [Helianthus annuus]XP_035842708.1 F-box/FBD/LRR-repeat protein At1g13570 isoform X1 [Helianthus annuus]